MVKPLPSDDMTYQYMSNSVEKCRKISALTILGISLIILVLCWIS